MSIFNMVLPIPQADYINKREAIATSNTSITFGGVSLMPSFYVVVKEPSTTRQDEITVWGLCNNGANTRCYMSRVTAYTYVNYDSSLSAEISNNNMVITMPVIVGEKYYVYYSYDPISSKLATLTSKSNALTFDSLAEGSYSRFALLLQRSSNSGYALQYGYYVRKDLDALQTIGYTSLDTNPYGYYQTVRAPDSNYTITESYLSYLYRLSFTSTDNLFSSGDYILYYA